MEHYCTVSMNCFDYYWQIALLKSQDAIIPLVMILCINYAPFLMISVISFIKREMMIWRNYYVLRRTADVRRAQERKRSRQLKFIEMDWLLTGFTFSQNEWLHSLDDAQEGGTWWTFQQEEEEEEEGKDLTRKVKLRLNTFSAVKHKMLTWTRAFLR